MHSTLEGGVTPQCNECGILLCWDIGDDEYDEAKGFWDDWVCQECNGGVRLSLRTWLAVHKPQIARENERRSLTAA